MDAIDLPETSHARTHGRDAPVAVAGNALTDPARDPLLRPRVVAPALATPAEEALRHPALERRTRPGAEAWGDHREPSIDADDRSWSAHAGMLEERMQCHRDYEVQDLAAGGMDARRPATSRHRPGGAPPIPV